MLHSNTKRKLINLNDEFNSSESLSIGMGTQKGKKVDVPLFELVKYSRVVQEELQTNYTIKRIQSEVQTLISNNELEEENVFNFYSLLSGERVEINNSNYWDLFKLSCLFKVEPLKRSLFEYSEEHSNDVGFMIELLKEEEKDRNMIEKNEYSFSIEYLSNIEEVLSNQINECFQNENFGKLSISTIYRILSKSSHNEIESDLLYEFINESIEERHPFFSFLKYSTMSDQKFNELYSNISKTSDSKSKHYYEYLRVDLEYIRRLKEENEYLIKENQRKDEYNEELQRKQNLISKENEELQNKQNLISKENEELQRKQNIISKENEEQKKQVRELLENQKQNERMITELKEQKDENKSRIKEMNEQMKLIKQKENHLNINEILEILLNNKETIEKRYRKGEILQYACEIQNSEFVKFILLSNDIDINSRSIFNNFLMTFKIISKNSITHRS